MKITDEYLEINPETHIPWEKVKSMKLLNHKLIIELAQGRRVEVEKLLPSSIDLVFRSYEHYLSQHPEKK